MAASSMTFWLFSGFDQKSGALICSSVEANCVLREAASKIAPDSVCLLPERRILPLEFVEGHNCNYRKQRPISSTRNATMTA